MELRSSQRAVVSSVGTPRMEMTQHLLDLRRPDDRRIERRRTFETPRSRQERLCALPVT